jgi:hypothetical protein
MRQELVMKKFSVFLMVVTLGLAACERHPASQLEAGGGDGLGARGEERGGEKENKSSTTSPERSPTPEASPAVTPKSYFPQNS